MSSSGTLVDDVERRGVPCTCDSVLGSRRRRDGAIGHLCFFPFCTLHAVAPRPCQRLRWCLCVVSGYVGLRAVFVFVDLAVAVAGIAAAFYYSSDCDDVNRNVPLSKLFQVWWASSFTVVSVAGRRRAGRTGRVHVQLMTRAGFVVVAIGAAGGARLWQWCTRWELACPAVASAASV